MRQFLKNRIGTLFMGGLVIYAFFIMETPKRLPPEKPNWIYWDMKNGRGITAKDTFYMTRNPLNRDEWVTKQQADSIIKSIRILPELLKKGIEKDKPSSQTEADIEGIVEDVINRNLD